MSFWTIYASAFGIIILYVSIIWLLSVYLKDASIVDIFWGLGFVLVAWFYDSQTPAGDPVRKQLITILTTIWGLRLFFYLLWRNWGEPEDYRYQNFRQKYGPERYWWFSYFQVFLLQGLLIWLISAPLLGAQISGGQLNQLDYMAIVIWLIGIVFEAGSDWQLSRFKRDPSNVGKLLTSGFWKYTRHPNYFGDAAVWWGFGLMSLAAGSIAPVLGALLMTGLIIQVSGVAMLERSLSKKKPGYEKYAAQTSPFIPWFPKSSDP